MNKFSISEAAKIKGVSPSTLRRWEAEGKLIPERT
ncbi:MerR family DNA-binding transcriptional regulator, partial [Spirulina sp. CS-785/01]